MKHCKRCALPESFPNISFNEEGVCNLCSNKISRGMQGEAIGSAAEMENIVKAIAEFRGNGYYDCLVCYSGGKDSTYLLKLCVEKFGLNPYVFCFDNGFISTQAFVNIRTITQVLGVDCHVFSPSKRFLKEVFRESILIKDLYSPTELSRISAVCSSCISMVMTSAMKLAMRNGIKLIFAGFTPGQVPSAVIKNNLALFEESRNRRNEKLKSRIGDGKSIDYHLGFGPDLIESTDAYPLTVSPLAAMRYDEAAILEEISAIGWTMPSDTDSCSSNCRLNSVGNYFHFRRYGFHPYSVELANLVRNGLMDKEEALERLRAPQVSDDLKAIADELHLDVDSSPE